MSSSILKHEMIMSTPPHCLSTTINIISLCLAEVTVCASQEINACSLRSPVSSVSQLSSPGPRWLSAICGGPQEDSVVPGETARE